MATMQFIEFPLSGNSVSSNPSVGPIGLPIPTSATLIAGVGPDGNLHPISTDNSGVLNVNLSPGGTVTANQGLPAVVANAWPVKITDGVLSASLTSIIAAQHTLIVPATGQIAASISMGWDGTSHREIAVNTNGQISLNFADVTATGVITNTQSVTLTATGLSSASILFTGVWTGTLTLEGSVDGVTFAATTGVVFSGGLVSSNFSSPNSIQVNVSAFAAVRIRGNTVTSGSATVFIRANSTAGPVVLTESLPQGGNTIGLVGQSTPNWTVNQTQVSGASITLGQKTMAASYPVVIASDQSGGGVINVTENGFIRANAPTRRDYSISPVTTGAYVQLVASTTLLTREIEIFDSSGQTLVLATGAPGAEVDQIFIFPGGNGRVKLAIPAASAVSIKAVSATANVGEISINWYG